MKKTFQRIISVAAHPDNGDLRLIATDPEDGSTYIYNSLDDVLSNMDNDIDYEMGLEINQDYSQVKGNITIKIDVENTLVYNYNKDNNNG